MKIVLTGDNHLGKKQYNNIEREKDFQKAWLWVCCKVAEINPEFFVIAGDLFDKKQVGPPTLSIAVEGLMQTGLSHVIAIEGNHDGRTYIHKGRSWIEYLHEQGLIDDILRPDQSLGGPAHGITFFGSPWAGRGTVEAFETALWDIEFSAKNYLRVGVFHAAPEGYVVGAGTIPPDMLLGSKFDLILMGHCHRPFNISNKVLCAGSPEVCDTGEMGNKAGIWIIDIDRIGKKSFEFLEYKPRQFVKMDVHPSDDANIFLGDDIPQSGSIIIVDLLGQRVAVDLIAMRESLQRTHKPLLIRISDKMSTLENAKTLSASNLFDDLVGELLGDSASLEEFNSLLDCLEADNQDGVIPALLEASSDKQD